MIDSILESVSNLPTPGFFVTVQFIYETGETPHELESFIMNKYRQIKEGITARKFIYQEAGWRMVVTFFPTNQVVDEKYALKNKVTLQKNNIGCI